MRKSDVPRLTNQVHALISYFWEKACWKRRGRFVPNSCKIRQPVTFRGVKRSWDLQNQLAGHVYGGQT